MALQIKTYWSEIVKSRLRQLRKEALASYEAFKNITLSHNLERVKPNYLTKSKQRARLELERVIKIESSI